MAVAPFLCAEHVESPMAHSLRYVPARAATADAIEMPLPSQAAYSTAKRTLDVVISSLALCCAVPFIAAIAIAIRVTSPGPVFFRQRRVGLRGKPFVMLKFRTMIHGVSESAHREYVSGMITECSTRTSNERGYKLRNDGRVTRVGHLLRRTSLDELPQFWNVLRGEMSLVGPRPPLEYEVDLYEPWQLERLAVRPGMSGLWQVSGRSRVSYVEMCRLDVRYVREWSLRRDLIIMLKTPWVIFSNSGWAA